MIDLRPVTAADDAFLLSVYSSTRAEEMALVGWPDERKRGFLEMQFRAQTTDYHARFPESDHSIIDVDGVAVGRMWVGRWNDEIRLLDIAILPEHRNRGTGQALLESLIEEARIDGTPLRHSVFKDNDRALRFYGRLGFEVSEDFDTYVLMEWIEGGSAVTLPG